MLESWEFVDFWQAILREVQESEVWEGDDVFNLGDFIALKGQLLQFFFTFKKWDVFETSLFECKLFSIVCTF